MDTNRARFQMAWGIALILMGMGVFFRIPQVTPKIAEIPPFSYSMGFVKLCFYLMGILLVGGGLRKVIEQFKILRRKKDQSP